MSVLARIIESLARGGTTLETYDRRGDLVHRVDSRALVDCVRAHRGDFAFRDGGERRVALLFRSEETVEFLIAAFAAIAEGLTVVPLYPNWTEEHQRLYLERYRLRAIAVGEGFRPRVEGWGKLVGRVIPIRARPGPEPPSPAAREAFPADLPADHPCALIFTSGSSGDLAKCTLITQANLAAAIENIAALGFLRRGMVLHCPLSASHIFAFVVILGFLGLEPKRVIFSDVQYLARLPEEKVGKIGAMILIPLVLNRLRAAFYERLAKSDPASVREGEQPDADLLRLARLPLWARRILGRLVLAGERIVIAREGGRRLLAPAWPLVRLLGRLLGPVVRRRLGSPEFVVVGGAKPSLKSMAFLEVMGVRCLQGWGMTETTGPLAVCDLRDRFRGAFGTCGNIFTGTSASLDGEELVVEGPQVAAGYMEPDGTLIPFGGRLRTGDFGQFDPRGRLRVLGKVSDRITLTNGLNYNPIAYEELVHSFDLRRGHLLEETVVIGDGQARLGCVFYLKEPHEPGDEVHLYLTDLLRAVNASLRADEQIGPWAVSPARLRDAGVLGPSAKIIRRRVEEGFARLYETPRLARAR